MLHESWNNYFENVPKNGQFLQICLRNPLKRYPKELRDRIHLMAIAPGAYTEEHLCASVVHYVSTRDIVPLFDREGRKTCRSTIRVLEAHKDAPWFDHDLSSPTYEEPIKQEFKKFIIKYGN